MGLFNQPRRVVYQPTAKDLYSARQKEFQYQRSLRDKQEAECRRIYDSISGAVDKERERVKKELAARVKEIRAKASAEEKRLLTEPLEKFTGSTHGMRDLVVNHWKCSLPGGTRTDGGPLFIISTRNGLLAAAQGLIARRPELQSTEEGAKPRSVDRPG